jgi:hypothetical protein
VAPTSSDFRCGNGIIMGKEPGPTFIARPDVAIAPNQGFAFRWAGAFWRVPMVAALPRPPLPAPALATAIGGLPTSRIRPPC